MCRQIDHTQPKQNSERTSVKVLDDDVRLTQLTPDVRDGSMVLKQTSGVMTCCKKYSNSSRTRSSIEFSRSGLSPKKWGPKVA